jgi:phosphopantetheinyl transferase (holo-ACP synthase)
MDLKVSSRVLGVGIDLVDVRRIATAIEKQGAAFLRRIYTDREREYRYRDPKPEVRCSMHCAFG